MRKIIFACLGLLACLPAMAAASQHVESGECHREWYDEPDYWNMCIYFDNAKPSATGFDEDTTVWNNSMYHNDQTNCINEVKTIIQQKVGNKDIAYINVQGNTSQSGSATSNNELARRRAKAVRNFLKTDVGLTPKGGFATIGSGETYADTFEYENDRCACFDIVLVEDLIPEITQSPTQIVVTENPTTAPDTSDAREQIKKLYAEIQDIDLGKDNVWKNKDGKFNTARLASDTIAAVTLGTLGGVITSTLVKKHQVKDGFEDIKCYIGGQSVNANYGDEFSVGVR